MKRLAVTGSLASGKSTVCRVFALSGAYVVSTDEIVHSLLASRADIQQRIVDLLGPGVVVRGQLDRKAIAKKVFSHAEALSSLEHILHPLVLDEMESRYTAIKDFQSYWLFVVEVPLLYETNSHTLFDVVVTVTAPKRLRQERCNKKEHALSWLQERNRRQLSQEEKAARAHYVLENNGTLGELQHKVLELINILQSP